MLQVTFDQLHTWLTAFWWPFLRILAFFSAAPLWGHSSVPRQVKLGLGLLISVVIVPTLPAPPAIPVMSWAGLGVAVEQLLIGLAMGLVMRVMFAVVSAAGDFIALQMGLAFATFVAPDTGANTMIVSRFLHMITLLMFLAVNGHLMVIDTLAGSFTTLPVAMAGLDASAFELLVRYGGTVFIAGLMLALPVVCALLITNLALGILNRSAPQLTVFSVGFPLSLTLGLFLLSILMTDLGRYLQGLFGEGLGMLDHLLEAMAV